MNRSYRVHNFDHAVAGFWGAAIGAAKFANVRCGLCKNPKTLNRDRRSYSSDTALVVRLAMEFNFKNELKNIILVAL